MATSSASSASSSAPSASSSSSSAPILTPSTIVAVIQDAVRREVNSAVSRALAVSSTPTPIPSSLISTASGSFGSTTTASSAASVVSSSLSGVSLMSSSVVPSSSSLSSVVRESSLPFIVSPSFPPVPSKIVEKIKANQFFELKELMPDNAALKLQLSELGSVASTSGSKLREIDDPLTWVFYFLSYLAVAVSDPKARELAAYGQVIIHIAQRHGGKGWQAYDRLFRQQIAAGAPLTWKEVSPSLLASTVFSGVRVSGCVLCNAADHQQSACALHWSRNGESGNQPPPAKRAKPEICRKFNKGECKLENCKYTHVCLVCGGSHMLTVCSKFRFDNVKPNVSSSN